MIGGCGRINGNSVVVIAEDFTVRAGLLATPMPPSARDWFGSPWSSACRWY